MINRRTFVASATASLLATPALTSTRLPRKFRPQEVDVNPELPASQIHVIKESFHLCKKAYLYLNLMKRF